MKTLNLNQPEDSIETGREAQRCKQSLAFLTVVQSSLEEWEMHRHQTKVQAMYCIVGFDLKTTNVWKKEAM